MPPHPLDLSRATFVRLGTDPSENLRTYRVPQFSRVRLRGNLEVIAAAPTPDGRAYFVPRWKTLDEAGIQWVAEKRSASSTAVIERNFAAQEGRIRRGIAEFFGVFPGDTFFVVGSGPSLLRHAAVLRRMPRAHVVAINGALKALSPGVAEFYFTLDWLGRSSWLKGVDTTGVKLITSVTTPPEILDRFADAYHFVGMTQARTSELGVNRKYAHLGQLDGGLTGSYAAMHFAYRCGAKRIVLVGQDFACKFGLYHWDEPLPFGIAADRGMTVAEDVFDGLAVLTDYQLRRNADLLKAAAMWCEQDGVEVPNATEGGILDWHKTTLAAVEETLCREADSPTVPGIPRGCENPPSVAAVP